jgi:hypothetical protein
MKNSAVISSILLVCIIHLSNCVYAQTNLDSVFVKWNKLTFRSIERQQKSTYDTSQKKYYTNRLDALKKYFDIKDSASVNSKSIRYEFLKVLFSRSYKKNSVFYLVESDESGYKVTIRNFVVYADSLNSVNIDYYTFSNSTWSLVEKKALNSCVIDYNLQEYVTKFWKGFNQDDVIVTKFEFGNLVESYFYLFYTLSSKSCFKEFL